MTQSNTENDGSTGGTRVWVEDLYGSLQVVVDYGYGPQLSLSVPSGRLAGYQAARDRCLAEAQAKIAEWVAGYVARGAVQTDTRYFDNHGRPRLAPITSADATTRS